MNRRIAKKLLKRHVLERYAVVKCSGCLARYTPSFHLLEAFMRSGRLLACGPCEDTRAEGERAPYMLRYGRRALWRYRRGGAPTQPDTEGHIIAYSGDAWVLR